MEIDIKTQEIVYQQFCQVMRYQLRYRRFDGDWSALITREVEMRPRVAAVLPYDPIRNQVVLIEQFRIGALNNQPTPWLLELVAGIMDQAESIEALARREMREEAGLEVLELVPITDYWSSPGCMNEYVSLFYARVDASKAGGIHGAAQEHEDIRVQVMDTTEAFDAVRSGRINNATTMIALQWLEINQKRLAP